MGNLVENLVNEEQYPGSHRIVWPGSAAQGKPLPSGMYYYLLKVDDRIQTKQSILVK
jgi:hypothetical protein